MCIKGAQYHHLFQANESRKLSQTGTDSDTGWSSPPMPLHPTINEDNSTRYLRTQCCLVDRNREFSKEIAIANSRAYHLHKLLLQECHVCNSLI